MNNTWNYINQRMSLRKPLGEALDVVEKLTDTLSLKKCDETNREQFIKEELQKAQTVCPYCRDFERDFPSFSFSIATGIGKTRLMGACIAYLYLKKKIRNFFILAPNLPIYEKLIRDFGDPSYEKYVFKGISEFVNNQPVIVNGSNYEQFSGRTLFSDQEIHINIFNISKFNSDNKATTKNGQRLAPKMKRLSEYIGQSYFEYLSKLDDLVILMDEAHRYHADASRNAINDLHPILGLEMTATPVDENGTSFKNIVYEYNLAQALKDGIYVKNPTVARRKNFQRGSLNDEELDILKLEDAVSIHKQTKVHLELYAKENNVKQVRPFILVVCKNINHATATKELIESEQFFNGEYQGKVLQIDSSTKKDEEVEALFVSLDTPENEIEIVVHVNMLKEGWDVSNLYTIVPLRAADAPILIEQSIGRGLRLPYGGKRTGVDEVDKLTVIAHENFDAVIAKAKDPNSVMSRLSYVELEDEDTQEQSVVVTAKTQQEVQLEKQIAIVKQTVKTENEAKVAQANIDAQKAVWAVLPLQNVNVQSQQELAKEENIQQVREAAVAYIKKQAEEAHTLFAEQEAEEQIAQVDNVIQMVVKDYIKNTIPIPRMTIQQAETKIIYDDFELDTSRDFNLPYLKEEIIRMGLVDNSVETIQALSSGAYGDPVSQVIAELMNIDEIDYDLCSDLLYKLAEQAVDAIKTNSNITEQDEIVRVVHQFKLLIARRIFEQIKAHMRLVSSGFIKPNILPFVAILPQHMTEVVGYGRKDYREVITPKSAVRKYIFTGFMKSYYVENKFDSTTEQDFAFILENESKVLKWLRPVTNQFSIYWGNGAHKYEPDFIVETEDSIYMIETKKAKDVTDDDVQAKKDAAQEYCKYATEYNIQNGGKPWQYILLPHDSVDRTCSFDFLMAHKA